MSAVRRIARTAVITAMVLGCLATSAGPRADDRKIIWRMVTDWTIVGGPADLPTRYERSNGDFATKSECLKQLELSQDRLEADRAEAEQNARKAGARDAEFKMTSECAPRYADTSSEPFLPN